MPPQPRPKSNLLAWLRGHKKPKPPTQLEIMLMNELLELIADVNALLAKLDAQDAEIISLKSELLANEIQANKDNEAIAAVRAKIKAKIDGTPGGSTGNM